MRIMNIGIFNLKKPLFIIVAKSEITRRKLQEYLKEICGLLIPNIYVIVSSLSEVYQHLNNENSVTNKQVVIVDKKEGKEGIGSYDLLVAVVRFREINPRVKIWNYGHNSEVGFDQNICPTRVIFTLALLAVIKSVFQMTDPSHSGDGEISLQA